MSELPKDLPGDPQLSALYREHARDEPSVAIDERILAAARAAVTAPVSAARRSWWQRWRTTLALTTTLTLTLTLALLHERQPGDSQPEAAVAPPPVAPGVTPASVARDTAVPAAPPTALSGDAVAAAGKAAAGVLPKLPAKDDRVAAPRVAPVAGEGGRLPAFGDAPGQAGSPAIAREEAPGSAPPRARQGNAVAGTAATAAAPAGASAEQEAAAVGQAPAARKQARTVAPSRADIARSADDWLDEIRALRRAGRSTEAAKQLADFRLAHPDYPLPEEFHQ
ncbi:MAG: hypothetical protein V5B60_20845 [Accumulibacter sp.]|jgi:hypothetical protein|uniref:hypothetical protein n=1 Tax=Accumulibacter sp. TaxID=2053492 RepID=UPI002FC3A23C